MSRNKYDRRLVAGKQEHEVQTVVDHMREKENIEVTHDEVKALVIEHGHSRTRIYEILKERHTQTPGHEINGLSDIFLPE